MLKLKELMFGMEIAIREYVREGRFLSKQAIRASGNGARSCTPLRCATHRTGSASRDHLEASDWPLSEARVIFRGGEMALRPFRAFPCSWRSRSVVQRIFFTQNTHEGCGVGLHPQEECSSYNFISNVLSAFYPESCLHERLGQRSINLTRLIGERDF